VASKREIVAGRVRVGGGQPVVVQSMTNLPTRDWRRTTDQIRRMADHGCELVRVAFTSLDEAKSFEQMVYDSPIPIIADIHYDWRLAIKAMDIGAAGVRVNPGTMTEAGFRRVVKAAKVIPAIGPTGADVECVVRIGANQGSLPRGLRRLGRRDPAKALVEAVLRWAEIAEELDFRNYKLSVKSSSVPVTIEAYRMLAERTEAPLHVGVTEAGTVWHGTIKNAVGIGALLAEGIGDTIRVSLAGDPVEEVRVAWRILSALGLRRRGADIIACPTCSRTEVDLVRLAEEVERRIDDDMWLAGRPFTVAVMGCRVNGPGEAKHADFGIAGGKGEGVVFDHGERIATVPESKLVDVLIRRMREYVGHPMK